MKFLKNIFLLGLIFLMSSGLTFSQILDSTNGKIIDLNMASPHSYELGGITVSGLEFLNPDVLIRSTNLKVGQKITVPGEDITNAILSLWKQKLFGDIKVKVTGISGNRIYLEFMLQEKPRLSKFSIKGLRKGESKNLREELSLANNDMVTENLIRNTRSEIITFFADKGYLDTKVDITVEQDPVMKNFQVLKINVDKGKRIKINEIIFTGNDNLTEKKLRRLMKKTKRYTWYNIFSKSRYLEKEFENDKRNIISRYNSLGFRDAVLISDSTYKVKPARINLVINISEGHKYYFRNIKWVGNSKYRNSQLDSILNIAKGAPYDQVTLDSRLNMNPNGYDVSSLYMDRGYLFFQINAVEVLVENDSIDLEIRIFEGARAINNKITVKGNTKTSDKVILREIRTRPGEIFSRADITRTLRELAQLGYFDPEKIGVNPIPNASTGTVDIEYQVEEKPSDQIELSGGWGQGNSVIGTLGLTLNNFSGRKLFHRSEWTPIPSGDGQRLSIRAQSTGVFYQSYNASFSEPWLGGKKPNSFTFSIYHNRQKSADGNLFVTGASVSLGKRLRIPDDFFVLQFALSYQKYELKNWQSDFVFNEGKANNINLRLALSRNSIDAPIYPTRGSNVSLSVQATPPYSLFSNIDYKSAPDEVKYKWLEYHKWSFDAAWYTKLAGKLVLKSAANFGFLGLYNRDIGAAPFERYYVGGSGLQGYSLVAREIVALRGYADNSLTPTNSVGSAIGGTIYNKYTMEIRYPFSLNPSATVYGLAFLEGGYSWSKFRDFNPFEIKRSAGVGIRVFLPMFGILGLDYAWPFNDNYEYVPYSPVDKNGQFHFSIGQQF